MTTHREDQIWWLAEHAATERDLRHWPPSLRPHAALLHLAAKWAQALEWAVQSGRGYAAASDSDFRHLRSVAARLEKLP